MNKPIKKNFHGLIDYTYATVVPLLPVMAGFKEQPRATVLCRILGGGALGYSLLTKAPWGIIHLLPFKTHLTLDLWASCFALASPWLLGFGRHKVACLTITGVGLASLAAVLLTDPEA